MDIVHPGQSIRLDHRLALLLGCSILAFLSTGILLIAALETDGFKAIKTAFRSALLIENVPRIAASAFHRRMIALGVEGLIIAVVAWILFGQRKQLISGHNSRQYMLEAAALFAICGIALMSFVMSCFLKNPIFENACSLHAKQGFIDTLHPIAFRAAATLLAVTALNDVRATHSNRIVPFSLLTSATVLSVVPMEEISWRQIFLGWRSQSLLHPGITRTRRIFTMLSTSFSAAPISPPV